MGHVPGLNQSSDRAELMAAWSAIQWQIHYEISMHLWTDSRYVADGISHILRSGEIGDWSNQDIWENIHLLLQQLGQLELEPHWVPSHLEETKLQDPFEDWVRCWNDRIDFAIGQYDFCRPREFLRLREEMNFHFERSAARMRQLQAFFFKVAANGPEVLTEPSESNDVSLFGFVDELQPSFGDLYNPDARDLICNSDSRPADLPTDFIFPLVDHLASHVDEASGVYPLSFEGCLFGWLGFFVSCFLFRMQAVV